MSFHQLVRAALSPKIITAMTSIAPSIFIQDTKKFSHLHSNLVVKICDQEVYFFYDLRFKPCSCSYDSHWGLTWSLTSGPMGLVEVRASWSGHPR